MFNNKPHHMKKFRIKKHDEVMVRAGKDKGRTGRVIEVDRENDRVYVEGVNIVVRNQRPNQMDNRGQVEKTKSIHISNVSLFVEINGQRVPTKIRVSNEGETRQRFYKKNNQVVEEYNYAK